MAFRKALPGSRDLCRDETEAFPQDRGERPPYKGERGPPSTRANGGDKKKRVRGDAGGDKRG